MFRLKVRLHGSDVNDFALESGRDYTFGRSTDCNVKLEDAQGISRQHFRIFESPSEGWMAEVISKFGDISVAGSPAKGVKLENGTVFKLAGYDFMFYEQQSAVVSQIRDERVDSHSGAIDVPVAMAVGQSSAALVPAPQDFEGSDEATRVMETQAVGDVYLRIVETSGREETIKLEGRKWIAGREEGSQILLNDRKASRRQFELVASPQGNFVRDLGSSNGTQLNGMPLAPDELKPLRSGDLIQVGALQIYFEVRDPHFERRLSVVPKDVLQTSVPAPQPLPFEMINYPVVQGPGGAVRVGPGGLPAAYDTSLELSGASSVDPKAARTKKIRFALIAAIVILPLVYVATNDSGEKKAAKKTDSAQLSPQMQAFVKLTPQKQQFVKEAYILGKNLVMQGKFALASEQMSKIHELLKDGYEDSRRIAEECENALQQERNRQAIADEMERARVNKQKVLANLEQCKPIADRTFDESEFMSCLQPTIELDPENPAIAEGKIKISARVAQRDMKNAAARAYASKVARGEELFHKAEAIEKRGDNDGAVEAYRAHLAANLPDPKNFRSISKKKVGIIEANKAASIASYLSTAETAFVNHDYKTAINNINKVKGLDPYNSQAAELNSRISREKDQKLREIYEESILNEGLGQIDQAKSNWKKIMDMDHPDGIYYKRARNKMKSLGGL